MHFGACPSGLDDFTTQWLLEFLILAAWSSDFLFNFNVSIMLQALLKSAGVFRPIGLNFSIGCFCCGAGAKTKATNASNERIADKTNQLNYQMWQEQKQYDYDKWKEELAYNTPSAQRKRFEEAGINPNLAIAQISGGNAESAATSGNRPDAIAAEMQNPAEEVSQYSNNLQNIAGGFNNLSRTFQQNQLDAAQTRAVSVDADIQSIERNYRAAQLEATINKLVKDGQLSEEQAKNLRVNTFINSATADSQIKQKQYEAENAQKQGKVLDSVAELNLTNKIQSEVQTKILSTELRYLPRKLQVEIQKIFQKFLSMLLMLCCLVLRENLLLNKLKLKLSLLFLLRQITRLSKILLKLLPIRLFMRLVLLVLSLNVCKGELDGLPWR